MLPIPSRRALPLPPQTGIWADFADRPAPRCGGRRIYAIGDIHGSLRHVTAMQDAIAADLAAHPVKKALIIYLGDVIDRGPASAQVIASIIAHRDAPPPGAEVITLSGNHEAWFCDFLDSPEIWPTWGHKGGLQTMTSYGFDLPRVLKSLSDEAVAEAMRQELLERMPPSHLAYLRGLRLTHVEGDYLFVHAGLNPQRPLSEQTKHDLTWIRYPFLNSTADFGKVAVHGHSPVCQVENLPNRINIDTGIYTTSMLSCVILEGSERHLLQVDGHFFPYPDAPLRGVTT